MNHAVVFHRFNLSPTVRKVWEDSVSPTIASIATLRAVNKQVKVYVLDTEPFLEDWGHFPKLLNFHVVQQPLQIPIRYTAGCPFQERIVSRLFDVWAFAQLIPERFIVYSDSDIFWLKDPFPLANDLLEHFYADDRGDGFFYFNKHSLQSEVFVNVVRGLTMVGILSDEIRTKMRISGYHSPMFMSEMPMMYALHQGVPGCGLVDRLEHYYPASLSEPIEPNAKCLHAHSGLFDGKNRLQVVRRVREFSDGIKSVLPEREAALILGGEQPDIGFMELGKW